MERSLKITAHLRAQLSSSGFHGQPSQTSCGLIAVLYMPGPRTLHMLNSSAPRLTFPFFLDRNTTAPELPLCHVLPGEAGAQGTTHGQQAYALPVELSLPAITHIYSVIYTTTNSEGGGSDRPDSSHYLQVTSGLLSWLGPAKRRTSAGRYVQLINCL